MHWRNALPTILGELISKPRLGLVTDMDGTISPIVDIPDQAQVTPRSREILRELQTRIDLVAVVSGRAAADVRQKVNLPDLVYLGNHGLERWENGETVPVAEAAQYRPGVKAAHEELEEFLQPGMVIEDKIATLSVHYRGAENPELTAKTFRPQAQHIADKNGLRMFEGRMIFELRPPIEINKGTAFRHLIEQYNLDAALYIGDDTTDADALKMAQQLRQSGECYALGVGVQSIDMPSVVSEASDVLTSDVSDVEEFLDWLLKARSASSA